MKTIILLLISFMFTQISFASDTKSYLRADYGIGKFTSDKLDSLNANPMGSTIGAGFGIRKAYIELGLFYKVFNYSTDITHDGVANKIAHDGKSYGVDMNIFINNHLGLKLGYAFNNYKQSVEVPVSTVTQQAIKNAYGLEDKNTANIFYGANIDLFAAKRWDVSTSIVHFPMGDGKSSTSVSVGLKIYMEANFTDFFGAN